MELMTNYKEIQPTYGEFSTALKSLGFKEVNHNEMLVFVDKSNQPIVLLPSRPTSAYVDKARFVAWSYNLRDLGFIAHEHDLGKMVEANRLQQKAAA